MSEQLDELRSVEKTSEQKQWRGPQGLRALRHRNFLLYWIGQVISFTGSWVQSVAQGWLVMKLTGSAMDLGIVGAMGTLPVLFLGLPAGAIADRFDKRKIVIATQTLAMIQAFILAILTYAGVIKVWHVMLLAGFSGVINAFDTPNRHSMTVELVDGDHNDVLSAVSLGSTAFNGARVAGPALAGVMLVAFGEANCFFINAISYVAALLALLLMTPRKMHRDVSGRPMLLQIREGMSYVMRSNLMRDLLLMSGLAGMFGGQIGTIMPVFAHKVYNSGPKGLGMLMASTGIGALLGAVVTTALGHKFRQSSLVLFGAIFASLGLLAFSRSPEFHIALGFLVCTGLGSMLLMAVSNSIFQEAAPNELRGRVISLRIFVLAGLSPIGALLVGYLSERLGPRNALTIFGMASLISAVYFTLSSRGIRSYKVSK